MTFSKKDIDKSCGISFILLSLSLLWRFYYDPVRDIKFYLITEILVAVFPFLVFKFQIISNEAKQKIFSIIVLIAHVLIIDLWVMPYTKLVDKVLKYCVIAYTSMLECKWTEKIVVILFLSVVSVIVKTMFMQFYSL